MEERTQRHLEIEIDRREDDDEEAEGRVLSARVVVCRRGSVPSMAVQKKKSGIPPSQGPLSNRTYEKKGAKRLEG